MDKIEEYLPFKMTLGGVLGFVAAVAIAVIIAKKLPVIGSKV